VNQFAELRSPFFDDVPPFMGEVVTYFDAGA